MGQLVLLPNSLALVELLRKIEDGVNACKSIELPVLVAEEAMSKVEKIMLIFDPGGVVDNDVKGLVIEFYEELVDKTNIQVKKMKNVVPIILAVCTVEGKLSFFALVMTHLM